MSSDYTCLSLSLSLCADLSLSQHVRRPPRLSSLFFSSLQLNWVSTGRLRHLLWEPKSIFCLSHSRVTDKPYREIRAKTDFHQIFFRLGKYFRTLEVCLGSADNFVQELNPKSVSVGQRFLEKVRYCASFHTHQKESPTVLSNF